jgi:hypothetical protein
MKYDAVKYYIFYASITQEKTVVVTPNYVGIMSLTKDSRTGMRGRLGNSNLELSETQVYSK